MLLHWRQSSAISSCFLIFPVKAPSFSSIIAFFKTSFFVCVCVCAVVALSLLFCFASFFFFLRHVVPEVSHENRLSLFTFFFYNFIPNNKKQNKKHRNWKQHTHTKKKR